MSADEPTAAPGWEAVIGLEVHCQLRTATKLFCGCRNAFGEPPNTLVCEVCTGQPGALPVLNREALELAVRVALALGCDVAPESRFDRKNYFYCDLPKGYQISQLDRPYCTGGGLELEGGRRVRLRRIHLEEDAGKAIHDRGDATLVDLNRAAVPLIEAVTEPDLRTPEEAQELLQELRAVFQYVGASDGDLEKGSLRCDVNVSVRRPHEEPRTKVEVKNLNSFAHVRAALEHEIARQVAAYESGDPARAPVQETRLWDARAGATRPMRGKEDAQDYRYFPEPDLPPVSVGAETLERQRGFLPELPAARRRRYVRELGLSEYDARVLTASRAVADFFERTAELSGAPKEAANLVSNELLRLVADPDTPFEGVDELPLRPADLAEVIALARAGEVSKSAAKRLVRAAAETGRAPRRLIQELGLAQVRDEDAIEGWCRAAIEAEPGAAADVRAGKQQALGKLIGAVMRTSGGGADPGAVRAALRRLLDGEAG